MTFKIGFQSIQENENTEANTAEVPAIKKVIPCVVLVFFTERNRAYSYYNDKFDLREGDIVYVEGKLEGQQGHVKEIDYNFKIKLSEYKKIIGVIDTTIRGKLYFAGSHMITFDPETLPYEKILRWYKAPSEEDYVFGYNDSFFLLDDLHTMKIDPERANKGYNCYIENKIIYLSLDGGKGKAIAIGSKAYELEFQLKNGEISALTCDCFCNSMCKHEFGAMLQLKDLLERIEKDYKEEYEAKSYFAAISKEELLRNAFFQQEHGSITFGR